MKVDQVMEKSRPQFLFLSVLFLLVCRHFRLSQAWSLIGIFDHLAMVDRLRSCTYQVSIFHHGIFNYRS